ncbi:MAG: phosphatidate cytidylyltransferase [Elusimicrobiota bacterium]|jgi:phosphatidate cytidylyltransferase
MLLPRFLTAVIGVPLLLGSIYFGSLPFFFVVLCIVLLGLHEFYYLAQETGYPCYEWVGLLFGALLLVSIYLNAVGFGQVTENQGTAALISLALLVFVLRSLARGPADTTLSEWGITFFGLFYVAWSFSHLVLLRDLRPNGQVLTFFLFVLIWVEDIVAYAVGLRWGKHPIATAISPKKTWEGTVAGLLGALVVGTLFQQLTDIKQVIHLPGMLLVSLITGLLAFFSDLGESMIKRGAGVKDSSTLLPGHGGILDRFDAFILAAPVFYYYWAFFKR